MRSRSDEINIAGHGFLVDELPEDIKELLQLFTKWTAEKDQAINEVRKLDAALRSISVELATRVSMLKAGEAINDGNIS
jgi:hypothetical protein